MTRALDALAIDALGLLARAFGLALPNDDRELGCPYLERILQIPINLVLTGIENGRGHLAMYAASMDDTRGIDKCPDAQAPG